MEYIQEKRIIKKVHQVGASLVVTIDPSLVKKLKIDETTFLSQESIKNGLLMKIKKFTDDNSFNVGQ
jgi:hypothetical protein